MQLKLTTCENKDYLELIKMLDDELNKIYGKAQSEYDKYNSSNSLKAVAVAYIQNEAAGCAVFKHYDKTTAELKRMFVSPRFRKRGVSKKILVFIEEAVKNNGYTKIILETGPEQKAAIALYEKMDYKKIPNYDQYKDMPLSVCYEKLI